MYACAVVHVSCIGRIDSEWIPKSVATLSEAVKDSLKLPIDRVFVALKSIPPATPTGAWKARTSGKDSAAVPPTSR